MLRLLDSIADSMLSTTAFPVALLVRLPLMTMLAFAALWFLVRGVVGIAATVVPTLGRVLTHLVWYAFLWPDMWLSRLRAKRSLSPSAAQYAYGENVDLLAFAIRWMFSVAARCLGRLSRMSNGVLVGLSVLWAACSVVTAWS